MPIYEYRCEHCGKKFEVLQKFNEGPLTTCILCSEGPVKKLISTSAFVLKGAGFYVNDYPSANRKYPSSLEKQSSSDSASDTSSSKPAATTETAKAA